MMLPYTYSHWVEDRKPLLGAPDLLAHWPHLEKPEEAIRLSVNWLLERLYEPDKEQGCILSRKSLRAVEIAEAGKEPINWGDISCVKVERLGENGWLITLEEAAPGDCPALCGYVQGWLEAWGWGVVKMLTEW